MKKQNLIVLIIAVAISIMLIFVACDEIGKENKEATIVSISAIEGPREITAGTFDPNNYNIKVTKSDGTTDYIRLSLDMISVADYNNLRKVGTHEITIMYKNVSTLMTIVVTESPVVYEKSIRVEGPQEIDAGSFNIEDYKVTVTNSDYTKKEIALTEDMILTGDYNKLSQEGEHTITIFYNGLTTQITIKVNAVYKYQDFEFSLNKENGYYYVLEEYKGRDSEVEIPDFYNSKPVMEIGSHAFSDKEFITSVKIPESVTKINKYAFTGCKNLTSLIIPDSVEYMSMGFLSGCNSLQSLTIPFVGKSVESTDTNLQNLFYEYYKEGDENKIPQSLQEVVVTKFINDNAFANCPTIDKVIIGEKVKKIGYNAFYDSNIQNVYFMGDLYKWCWMIFSNEYSNPMSTVSNVYISNELVQGELTINENIEWIKDYAFYNCDALTKVNIANNIKIIGEKVFYECDNLSSINYQGTLSDWCKISFYTWYGNPMYYNDNVYIDNNKIAGQLIIPEDITTLESYAFVGCDELTSVIIHDNVTGAGNDVFKESALTCATLPTSAINALPDTLNEVVLTSGESINYLNFAEFSNLNSITLPATLTSIEDLAFLNCESLQSIVIPDSVENIGSGAFNGCKSLQSVTLPESLTKINNDLFYYCESLSNINIPSGVTYIGDSAFLNCYSLTEITIPDGVNFIGKKAFYYCRALKEIAIPQGIKEIKEMVFAYCTELESVTLPEGLLTIDLGAFSNCYKLRGVEIPQSVTAIGNRAFERCSITNIIIPDNVESIGSSAFEYCVGLTQLIIPDGITTIQMSTFYNCSNLASIVIPESVTEIQSWAFNYCPKLSNVYFKGTQEQWNLITIGENNQKLLENIIYYYSESEPALNEDGMAYNGNYWHYVDGVPTIWIK